MRANFVGIICKALHESPATKLHTNGFEREATKRDIAKGMPAYKRQRGTEVRRSKREFGTFSFVLLCPRARSESIELFWSGEHELDCNGLQSERVLLSEFVSFFLIISTLLFIYPICNESLVSSDLKICKIN